MLWVLPLTKGFTLTWCGKLGSLGSRLWDGVGCRGSLFDVLLGSAAGRKETKENWALMQFPNRPLLSLLRALRWGQPSWVILSWSKWTNVYTPASNRECMHTAHGEGSGPRKGRSVQLRAVPEGADNWEQLAGATCESSWEVSSSFLKRNLGGTSQHPQHLVQPLWPAQLSEPFCPLDSYFTNLHKKLY